MEQHRELWKVEDPNEIRELESQLKESEEQNTTLRSEVDGYTIATRGLNSQITQLEAQVESRDGTIRDLNDRLVDSE